MPGGVADGALIIDTGLDNSGFIRNAAQFRRAVQTLTQAVKTSGQQMAGGMDGYLRALQRAGAASKGATADQKALTAEIAKTEAAIKRLEERQELARRKFEAAKEDAIGRAQEEFQASNAGADAMPWENEEQALEALSEELNRVAQEASDAFGQFEDSTAFRNTSVEIEYLQEKLAALQEQLAATREQQPQGDGGAAEQARQAGEQAENAAEQASSGWQRFGSVVGQAAGSFLRVAGAAARAGASIARVAGGAALGYLRKLADGAKNAAIQLAKLSGRAIGSGFKTLGRGILDSAKALLGFNRASNQGNDGLKRGLMAVLKYGLGIRGLFALFRRLRTAISEGLGEIAKQNPRVNAQLNSFKAALNGLKGSLASAFAPIFTAVGPALTYLINMLTAAINTIAAFMAALTGQSTYQKAVAGISGAGGAASNAGSAADDAAESYKELKRELAGFDDLEILGSKDADSGSGSGGGGGGGGGGYSYETEEIGSGIVDFVAKLKEMWANADYEGIGRIIADGINSAFAKAKDWISWDNLGAKITEVVNGITGIINGLVDGVNWELIGQTFGEGINTLVRTINLLLTGIDWENIGKGFADGLGGLVDTVHWGELGQLFANKLNALIGTIKGFVSDFRWGDAGTSFAKALNGLFDTVKWSDLSDAATTAINGILATMKTLVSGFRWDNAATNITNAINRLFDGVDWDALGEVASGAINKILATMKTIVSGFRWENAASNIVRAINGLFDGVKWDDLVDTASTAINKILATMKTIVNGFRWENAATNLTNAINRLFDGVEWDDLTDTATTALNKIIATIKVMVSSFRWGDAGTKFGEEANRLFSGTNWTELGEAAAAAIGGPLETLKNAVSEFSFGDAATSFAKTVNGFFSNKQLWADAGETVSKSIIGMFTFGKDFFDDLDTEQIASDIKAFLKEIDWAGIASSIFQFALAAMRAIGNLFLALLFGPDYKNKTALAQEAQDYLSGVVDEINGGKNYTVNWGLRPVIDAEALEALGTAYQEALQSGNFVIPTDVEIDPASIAACYNDFVAEWNLLHPEAPLDPILPEDVGPLIEKQLEGVEAEVDTTPEADKQTWFDKLKGKKLEAPVDATLNPTNTPASAFKTGVALEFKANMGVNSGQDANSKFKTGTPLAFGANMNVNSGNDANAKFKTGTPLDFKARLTGQTGDSKTPAGLFGASFNVQSKLTGKTDDTKTLSEVHGDKFGVKSKLTGKTDDTKTLKEVHGDEFGVKSKLSGRTGDSKKLTEVHGDDFTVKSKLKGKTDDSKSLTEVFGSSFDVKASLDSKSAQKIKSAATKALKGIKVTVKAKSDSGGAKLEVKKEGGAITRRGRSIAFARGGVLSGGVARYLENVPHYAAGTTRAHGTVFVAGEAGPEIMGHINGRTEILNKSQLARTMYSAVLSAMSQAVSALGTFLSGQLANCTNAIVGTLGSLSGVANIQYHAPVMASGTVLPYDVAAQIERAGMDIQNTLDSNNEDLIQTIISVIGAQTSAIVSALRTNQQQGTANNGLTAQQLINDINRRAQMFGGSPLLD